MLLAIIRLLLTISGCLNCCVVGLLFTVLTMVLIMVRVVWLIRLTWLVWIDRVIRLVRLIRVVWIGLCSNNYVDRIIDTGRNQQIRR